MLTYNGHVCYELLDIFVSLEIAQFFGLIY